MQVAGTCLGAYCKHMELDVMSICDLNTLGILSIKENQTLLDLFRLCGKTKGKKQNQVETMALKMSCWAYITADGWILTEKERTGRYKFKQTHIK